MATPLHRLLAAINAWHRGALASMTLTPEGLVKMAGAAGVRLDLDIEMLTPERSPSTQGVPTGDIVRCTRCGRKLQFVHTLNGAAFGSVCVRKEMK